MHIPANLTMYGLLAVGAGGLIVMLLTGSFLWRWKLNRWALDEGVTLVKFRDAGLMEGPGRRARGFNEHLFRVEAVGPTGAPRKGWAMFVTRWGMSISATFDWVQWDQKV